MRGTPSFFFRETNNKQKKTPMCSRAAGLLGGYTKAQSAVTKTLSVAAK